MAVENGTGGVWGARAAGTGIRFCWAGISWAVGTGVIGTAWEGICCTGCDMATGVAVTGLVAEQVLHELQVEAAGAEWPWPLNRLVRASRMGREVWCL